MGCGDEVALTTRAVSSWIFEARALPDLEEADISALFVVREWNWECMIWRDVSGGF